MKTDIKTIVMWCALTAIAVFISLAIIGHYSLKEEARENDVLLPRNEFKEIFMEKCTENDPNMEAYCSCSCDYLLDNYTAKEMSDAYNDTQKFNDMTWDAYKHCKDLAY